METWIQIMVLPNCFQGYISVSTDFVTSAITDNQNIFVQVSMCSNMLLSQNHSRARYDRSPKASV